MNKRRFIGLSVLVLLSLLLSLLVSGCQNRTSAQEIVAKLREVETSTEDAHAVLEISVQGQENEEVVVEAEIAHDLVSLAGKDSRNRHTHRVVSTAGQPITLFKICSIDGHNRLFI